MINKSQTKWLFNFNQFLLSSYYKTNFFMYVNNNYSNKYFNNNCYLDLRVNSIKL